MRGQVRNPPMPNMINQITIKKFTLVIDMHMRPICCYLMLLLLPVERDPLRMGYVCKDCFEFWRKKGSVPQNLIEQIPDASM